MSVSTNRWNNIKTNRNSFKTSSDRAPTAWVSWGWDKRENWPNKRLDCVIKVCSPAPFSVDPISDKRKMKTRVFVTAVYILRILTSETFHRYKGGLVICFFLHLTLNFFILFFCPSSPARKFNAK